MLSRNLFHWKTLGYLSKENIEAIEKINYKKKMCRTCKHTVSVADYTIYETALNKATTELRKSKSQII